MSERLGVKKLRVLLDSDSLKSDSAKRLLQYNDNELFEFVSLGDSKKHTVADLNLETGNCVTNISIDKSTDYLHGYKSSTWFGYSTSDIQAVAKHLDIKYGDLILVYILKTLIETDQKTILVTERKKLLNPLHWKKESFPSVPPHSILSPDEAMIFVDLHCKKYNIFFTAPDFTANKGLWYLYSMKTKLTAYQPVWSTAVFDKEITPDKDNLLKMTASLGDRIIDMLTAVDEIGTSYYTDVNNDTQATAIYHFNYWIMLFTGVLDSLAWISKYRYQIEFEQFERIGLRTKRQKDFAKLLFEKNPKLKDFLCKSSSVINLMYDPRDLVIHRARLKGLRFDNQNENFYLNMLRIPEGFFNQITELSKEKGDTLGEWGHYRSNEDYFLEPYRFVKKATSTLIQFTNEYLELLDFAEYRKINVQLHEELSKDSKSESQNKFSQDLDRFAKYKLGY